MKMTIKRIILASLAGMVLALIITACGALGTNPNPPTKAESFLYNTTTNYIPTVQILTNVQVVTKYETNTIPITNAVGVTAFLANVVTVQQTNTVLATNTIQTAAYTETLKPGVTSTVNGAGGVLNTFFPGVGAMVVQGVLALLAGWGYMRSSKLGDTSTALAQEIEGVRKFIQALPGGAAYDSAFVSFMQGHQAEAGVVQEVVTTLDKYVKNSDAQAAAAQMTQFIQQLQVSANGLPLQTNLPGVTQVG